MGEKILFGTAQHIGWQKKKLQREKLKKGIGVDVTKFRTLLLIRMFELKVDYTPWLRNDVERSIHFIWKCIITLKDVAL